jgi:uridine kinase
MDAGSRRALIADIANHVTVGRGLDGVRVGIDGIDASGKTRFADELALALQACGRDTVRVSADDWHQQRVLRHDLATDEVLDGPSDG